MRMVDADEDVDQGLLSTIRDSTQMQISFQILFQMSWNWKINNTRYYFRCQGINVLKRLEQAFLALVFEHSNSLREGVRGNTQGLRMHHDTLGMN